MTVNGIKGAVAAAGVGCSWGATGRFVVVDLRGGSGVSSPAIAVRLCLAVATGVCGKAPTGRRPVMACLGDGGRDDSRGGSRRNRDG